VLIVCPFVALSHDLGAVFYIVITLPIVSALLFCVFRQIWRQRRRLLMIVTAYWVVSAMIIANYSVVRDATRWLFLSRSYRAAVLAQPDSVNGTLKHTEWEGWGFAGSDTVVYLVFAPNDSLAADSKRHEPVKARGIPCEVPRIRRLESDWYAVMFYTDTSWDYCGPAGR